ncbi:MAG: hypothetical protein GY787_05800 [Alteromonadales bacterium]|nr:hypothetical protein [Alteromonadales bacterium]
MINQIELDLLAQYDSTKIPSLNSVAYKLLLILLAGGKHKNPDLYLKINGTTNNAVTRLRGEFHWLVHHKDGYWWLDARHFPINGCTCIRKNREASAEAFKLYADSSAKKAKHGRIREPQAIQKAISAGDILQEVRAE